VRACILWASDSLEPVAALYVVSMLEIFDPARAAFEAVRGYAE
jgi:hypothetical protein